MLKVTVITALLLTVGLQTSSATNTSTAWQMAGLYAACAPMIFTVADLSPEGEKETGLTKQAIINAVESRLRGARLFVPLGKQGKEHQIRLQNIHVVVSIYAPAFSVIVSLERLVEDLGYGLPGIATVWIAGKVGTHGGDGTLILGLVSEILDEFLVNYLRVNEADCAK